MLMIELPFPPSINHAWRHRVVGKRAMVYMSQEALNFRAEVKRRVGTITSTKARLSVTIALYAPNKRRYDIDNRVKAVLDAFTHAGVWDDDEQIDMITVFRGDVSKDNGSCFVHVEIIK